MSLWRSTAFRRLATLYQNHVHSSLKQYGLRYEDVMMAEDPFVKGALKYIPKKEVVLRQRRLKRAMDLSLKHQALPAAIQDIQEPGKSYLGAMKDELQGIAEERELFRKGS